MNIKMNEKNEAFYMCPKCTAVYKLTGIDKEIPNFEIENYDGYFISEFVLRCAHCGESMLVDIDPNIFRDIVIMNRKGYKTYFCCESHHNDFDIPDFYVAFSVHKTQTNDIDHLIKTLPSDWVLEKGSLPLVNKRVERGYVLRVNMSNWFEKFEYTNEDKSEFLWENPISSKEYEKKKKRYLKEFTKIVKSLPELNGKINNRVVPVEIKVKSI